MNPTIPIQDPIDIRAADTKREYLTQAIRVPLQDPIYEHIKEGRSFWIIKQHQLWKGYIEKIPEWSEDPSRWEFYIAKIVRLEDGMVEWQAVDYEFSLEDAGIRATVVGKGKGKGKGREK